MKHGYMKPLTVYIETEENWHPSFDVYGKKLLRLSLCELRTGFRVCVWGADDFGMERDYVMYEEALQMFNNVCANTDPKTQRFLVNNGFIVA